MPLALLFIDGVGVGAKDPDLNPLARGDYLLSRFEGAERGPLPFGGIATAVDTTFDVRGRPQSASNQTALLTGLPAPRIIGQHILGFPNAPLRALLAEHSIVRKLTEAGREATFANAYPAGYLDALGLARRPSQRADVEIPRRLVRKLKASATTLAMSAGRVPLRTLDDARADEALTHDIDGRRARSRGFEIPGRSPEEAAAIFWRVAKGADFTLFEHYLADEAGHAQDMAAAEDALATFDRFLRAVALNRPAGTHVLVCSDHGNVEDLSTRSHTLNQVPVLYFGPAPEAVIPALTDVADVGRIILGLLGVAAPAEIRP
ncbi:MAG: metalloenzyme [Myxococcaceae bacterium]|nr:metalloenzyme [Myxococcaceae bacterium]